MAKKIIKVEKNCNNCIDEKKDLTHKICRACWLHYNNTGKKFTEWRSK